MRGDHAVLGNPRRRLERVDVLRKTSQEAALVVQQFDEQVRRRRAERARPNVPKKKHPEALKVWSRSRFLQAYDVSLELVFGGAKDARRNTHTHTHGSGSIARVRPRARRRRRVSP